jgi:23S rRNA pseudouridine1911/1915/1917 synthase
LIEEVTNLKVEFGRFIRLDKFLVEKMPEHSRSRLQAAIKCGLVTVNSVIITKNGFVVKENDEINLRIQNEIPVALAVETTPLDIIFQNNDLVIVNKPAGMVVHPAAGHAEGTLVNAALGNFPDFQGINGELRPGVVHRLDKDTSGLIILAKNEQAHRWLQDQFRLRKVEKVYIALVEGRPPTPTGKIDAAIARDPSHRKKMAIVSPDKGRSAVTEYLTLKEFKDYTIIEAHPLTGRTHQIRLHMALIHCPIVGDTIYGRKKPSLEINRHFLHAYRISIILPGEIKPRQFEAPLTEELQNILDNLS